MKYLTQVFVGMSKAAQCRFTDCYAWHKALWTAFPGQPDASRRFLFRVDDLGTRFRVLLLSPQKPVPPVWGEWRTKPIAPDFLAHDVYRFQLKANPTMRRNSDRRRLAIYQEPRLREWIRRKAAENGFEIVKNSLVVGAPIDEFFVKDRKRGKHVSVDFQGALRVLDREAFRAAFNRGIGSAKSFGFGMLMLQPVLPAKLE